MQTLEALVHAPAERMADADITAAIELLLLTKKGITPHLITVVTHDGLVTLRGSTDSLLARARAEEMVLGVRGVRGVTNELVVRPDDVSGSDLYLQVGRALADDPATRAYHLCYSVAAGTVHLAGTVQRWAQKQLARRVVQGVRGVRHILDDQVQVRSNESPASDEEMTAQIKQLLCWDIRLNNSLVQVNTIDRAVYLSGAVSSAAAKVRLEAMAYQVGAKLVDARNLHVTHQALGVEPLSENEPPRTDASMAQAVRNSFHHDPRLLAFEPLVQVHDGVVTLVGVVTNLRARQAAEHNAFHVAGVWKVQNLLKVRPDQWWPDANIRQRVTEALRRDPYVGRFDFSVNVLSGKTYLYGWVDNEFERGQSAEVGAGISGVVEVENLVTVPVDAIAAAKALVGSLTGALAEPPPPNLDHDLAERIQNRFYWSALLHDQPIEVRVENGRVALTGTVATWLERQMAAHEAYELGAPAVNNHLRVRHAPEHSAA